MESSKCVSFILLLLLLPSSYPISFQIPNFTPSPNYILYQGDAESSSGMVELTSKVEPFRVGWVTYANEVLMWDSNSGKLSDFTCHFSFSINVSGPNMTNDGIEFFLAPVGFQIPPNSGGGYLGLFNTTTRDSSSNRIISVEFDTYRNPEWDPMEVQTHVVLVIVLLIGTLLAYVIIRQRKKVTKRAEVTNLTSINDDFEMGTGPRRFSYQYLASATNDFSQDRKLGEGGFGVVYRGYLADVDMLIAVKKISKGSKQGRKEYVIEVKTISQLRHRNLVQLIGWCHERSEFLLVYEFMSNGSLDSHLFGKKSPFPWHIRYRITLGLASAILYLHEEWEQCVVHRDIKSSNVMLDSSFNVKLGDFGLAKLMNHELGRITTGLAGTFGYLAPEYISTRKASKESDVFSFGVVILEIATGRKSTDRMGEESDLGLVEWVWDLYGKGRLHSGVDERVRKDFDEKQAECLMIVGMWCSHPDSSLRPSIRLAIQVLKFETTMPNLPAKMPVPMYRVPTPLANFREPSISYSSIEAGR
ncbi:hypothetical protein SLEP1_g57790 [Rubroshorea leprosula]|uniref:non-specific serine/threonine protein kinase n=1 Tax=Rubroshorea leprosula TaxID=152421 RepID=A0AAV5MQV1_9ROSI|nr:hypothetical protein SLEP1_g57790 [Rubroshorea leprosula]